jgi:hypothetical protein
VTPAGERRVSTDRDVSTALRRGRAEPMGTILWLIAAVLVIAGIVRLVQGEVLVGVLLIIIGLLVGPGGVSIFAAAGPALGAAWPTRLTDVGARLDPEEAAGSTAAP